MIARMKYARRTRAAVHLGAALLLWAVSAGGQTLNLSNGVVRFTALTNTTVSLNGRCELWVTSTSAPLSGCTIHLNSTDAFFVASGIAPSVAVSTYLSQVRVGGAAAVADVNCRVVEYGTGAAVIPHPSGFRPLTIFSGPHFTGLSASCLPYVYYKSQLGALYANIGSFKLKRGYMATFAQNESGSGASRCCVAADGDMEVSVVPAAFDHGIRFVYVAPWRWTSKKGIAGNIESGLNVQWKYNWNIDQNSTRDLEYVPIRQLQYWPGLGQNWQSRGANHLLGYNEPDQSGQANLSVATAVSSWPDLLGTGLRLGSPATSDGGWNWWMYPFLAEADAASLRVDFVAVHYYRCRSPVSDAAGAASQMYDALKGIYDQTQRPLWVTEWNNGASWTGCGDPTYAQQRDVVAAIINMLDTTPFVERYSICSILGFGA